MVSIKKKIEFTASGTSDLTKETIEYFTQSGFTHIQNTGDKKLKFKCGSFASNTWTFNPLKWKSEIDIEISEQEIKANFNINTVGQIPTHKEEKLWDNFIDNYRKYLTDNTFDFKAENKKALSSTKKNSIKFIGWAILGGLIGGIPAGLIAYQTGVDSIVGIGAAAGAMGILMKKINDDKKKTNQ